MSVEHSEQGVDQQAGTSQSTEVTDEQIASPQEDLSFITLAKTLLAIEEAAHGGDDLRSFTEPSRFALD